MNFAELKKEAGALPLQRQRELIAYLKGLQKSRTSVPNRTRRKRVSAAKWYADLLDYEEKHPVAFASPSALAEARVIAKLEEVRKRNRRRKTNASARKRV